MTKSEVEPTELQTALIAGLALQADKLTKAASDLSSTYRFSRQLKVIFLIGFLMMAGLIAIALQNRSNGAAIRSCTTPTGKCYVRSQKATSQAVAQIVAGVNAHTDLVFIATLECSHDHPRSDLAFEACLKAKGVR